MELDKTDFEYERAKTLQNLEDTPALIFHLQIEKTRQTTKKPNPTKNKTQNPLPYNQTAAEMLTKLNNTLNLTKTSPPHTRVLHETKTAPNKPETIERFNEINQVIQQAWKIIDLAPDLHLAGRCACGQIVYTHQKAASAICPKCHAQTQLNTLKQNLLTELKSKALPPSQLAHLAQLIIPGITSRQARKHLEKAFKSEKLKIDQNNLTPVLPALKLVKSATRRKHA